MARLVSFAQGPACRSRDARAVASVDDRLAPLRPRRTGSGHPEAALRHALRRVRPAGRHRAGHRLYRDARRGRGNGHAEPRAAHRDRGVEGRHRGIVSHHGSADVGVHRTRRELRRAAGARTAAHEPRCFTAQLAREITMMLAHALLAFLAATNPPDSLLTPDSLLVELRRGGYTIVWRHTATDR